MILPEITMTRHDLDRLDTLLSDAVLSRLGALGEFLLNEITRARIINDGDVPSTLVTMGTTICFRDEESGRVSVTRLVYPHEAIAEEQAVSVLTPVGAALIGLSEGQSIAYETPDGRLKTLTVLKVLTRSCVGLGTRAADHLADVHPI